MDGRQPEGTMLWQVGTRALPAARARNANLLVGRCLVAVGRGHPSLILAD
jgi:hypothetical protein